MALESLIPAETRLADSAEEHRKSWGEVRLNKFFYNTSYSGDREHGSSPRAGNTSTQERSNRGNVVIAWLVQ